MAQMFSEREKGVDIHIMGVILAPNSAPSGSNYSINTISNKLHGKQYG